MPDDFIFDFLDGENSQITSTATESSVSEINIAPTATDSPNESTSKLALQPNEDKVVSTSISGLNDSVIQEKHGSSKPKRVPIKIIYG